MLLVLTTTNTFANKTFIQVEDQHQKALSILIPMIKKYEGFRAKPSCDHDGVLTIGYGFTKNVTSKTRVSKEQADMLLNILAKETINGVTHISPRLNEETPSFLAGVSDFAFNVGIGGYKHSALKNCVDRDEHLQVQHELRRWVHVKHKTLRGLVLRREAECRMVGND